MQIADYDYQLPEELIAQKPVTPRDSSRLLVVSRKQGTMEETIFNQLGKYLQPDDLLVFNDTRVLFARLYGYKERSGGRVEVLLLREKEKDCWEALVQPGKRVRDNDLIHFDGLLQGRVLGKTDFGGRLISFDYQGDFYSILEELGEMPLPPYIKDQPQDPDLYQTIYARREGAAAAPTAGLHFTEHLLSKLSQMGVEMAFLTLHVGLGTFRPVRAEMVEEHRMHEEYYQVDEEAAVSLNRARREQRRIIAVGTTVVRTLETVVDKRGFFAPQEGLTDLFIYPGYEYRAPDGLITNFHLPRSTLLLMISAYLGRKRLFKAYSRAIESGFRFYSFGDAMLII